MVARARPHAPPGQGSGVPGTTTAPGGRVLFPSETELRFHTSGRKSGKYTSRFFFYRMATAVDKFYELHPVSADYAAQDPTTPGDGEGAAPALRAA